MLFKTMLPTLLSLLWIVGPVEAACVTNLSGHPGNNIPDVTRLVPQGIHGGLLDRFLDGMASWNNGGCNIGGTSFPIFDLVPPPPGTSFRDVTVTLHPGFNPMNQNSCAFYSPSRRKIFLYSKSEIPATPGVPGRVVSCIDSTFADTVAHELGHTIGLGHPSANRTGYAMQNRQYDNGVYSPRAVKSAECKRAREINKTVSENGGGGQEPPQCQCFSAVHCGLSPPFATWECRNCQCLLTNSPLVLYLPDYYTPTGAAQDWWKRGFCSSETPTVCLDWKGDGQTTCTAWTEPGTKIVFVTKLSPGDYRAIQSGKEVEVEPWRHLFGNVTQGPLGEFPYAHGFEALAAHCGMPIDGLSEVKFQNCGATLQVWADRDADGRIELKELVPFSELRIEALSNVRETDKADRCGNTFPAESDASCLELPGKCGIWLDVFFESR